MDARTYFLEFFTGFQEIKFIKRYVEKGGIILDLMSGNGAYIQYFIDTIGYLGRIHSFEPRKTKFRRLKTLKKKLLWEKAYLNNSFLSDYEGKGTLYIPNRGGLFRAKYKPSLAKLNDGRKIKAEIEIDVETIDKYCNRSRTNFDFIRIDAEGNELNVIKGAYYQILQFYPILMVKMDSRIVGPEKLMETIKYVKELGYSCEFLHEEKQKSINEFSIEKHQNPKDKKNYCTTFIFRTYLTL